MAPSKKIAPRGIRAGRRAIRRHPAGPSRPKNPKGQEFIGAAKPGKAGFAAKSG
jgi:hypothetical protein